MAEQNKFEPREDSGNLFRVEDRKTDNHPEFEGEFKVRCPHCQQASAGWISSWVRESRAGKKYFSISFKHRKPRGEQT
jgi:hypothetical protein